MLATLQTDISLLVLVWCAQSFSHLSILKGHISSWGHHLPDATKFNYLPKVPSPITITLAVRVPTYDRHQNSVHNNVYTFVIRLLPPWSKCHGSRKSVLLTLLSPLDQRVGSVGKGRLSRVIQFCRLALKTNDIDDRTLPMWHNSTLLRRKPVMG